MHKEKNKCQVELLVMLFFATIILSTSIMAQTIGVKKNIVDTSKYGETFSAPSAYDPLTKTIYLNYYDYDYKTAKMILHEIGHHIWFYGGIDTTAILADLKGEYFSHAEILELFAEQHWRYFFNDASPAFHNIFYQFYNRDESKK